jgi:hypothetical protein
MGFWLGRRGLKDCVAGWGLGWAFGWVKGGLKALCGWLGPWMVFGLSERAFEESVWVDGAVDGLLAG